MEGHFQLGQTVAMDALNEKMGKSTTRLGLP